MLSHAGKDLDGTRSLLKLALIATNRHWKGSVGVQTSDHLETTEHEVCAPNEGGAPPDALDLGVATRQRSKVATNK